MGILAGIKRLFSKDITPDASKMVGLVNPYIVNGGKIKLNTKVNVPNGFVFALGACCRTLDTFNEGEYILSAATLPHACKKFKLHKQNKKGEFKKNFSAQIYFININEYEMELKTSSRAELGNRSQGIFTCGLSCLLKIKIQDARKLLNTLLDEFALLKYGEGEKTLKSIISEYILHILFRYNFSLKEILANDAIIESSIRSELSNKLTKIGVSLIDMKNVRYDVPSKYIIKYQKAQEELNQKVDLSNDNNSNVLLNTENENNNDKENVDKTELIFGNEDIPSEENLISFDDLIKVESEEKIEQSNTIEKETIEENQITITIPKQTDKLHEEQTVDYVPFGDMVIEEKNESWINDTKTTPLDDIETSKGGDFVDLNLDNLYAKEQDGKKCDYCGYVNDNLHTVCEVCGMKLKGDSDGENN